MVKKSNLNGLGLRSLASILLLILCLTISNKPVDAQNASDNQKPPVRGKSLSREKIAELLRKPNGLAAAANLVGTFVIDGQRPRWAYMNLANVVASSKLIIVGKIISKESRLSDDGDDIYTDYVVAPEKIIKGKSVGSVTFSVYGGLIDFPNGTSAQITTLEWQQLQVGEKYALLLSQADDHYYPANGVEALFKLSTSDGTVDAIAAHDRAPHKVGEEVKPLNVGSFLLRLQALSSSSTTQ